MKFGLRVLGCRVNPGFERYEEVQRYPASLCCVAAYQIYLSFPLGIPNITRIILCLVVSVLLKGQSVFSSGGRLSWWLAGAGSSDLCLNT